MPIASVKHRSTMYLQLYANKQAPASCCALPLAVRYLQTTLRGTSIVQQPLIQSTS